VVYLYWVKNERERLLLQDYSKRTGIFTSIDHYIFKQPLLTKTDEYFGNKNGLSVVATLGAHKRRILELCENQIINPEHLLISNDLHEDEIKIINDWKCINPDKVIHFDNESALIKYLNEREFSFNDGSIPFLSSTELEKWLIYISSKAQQERLLGLLLKDERLWFESGYSFGYGIIKGILEMKDGRAIGKRGKYSLYLEIRTSSIHKFCYNYIYKLIEKGEIERQFAIQQKDIKDKYFKYKRYRDFTSIKNYVTIVTKKDYKSFLKDHEILLEDGTVLTPKDNQLYSLDEALNKFRREKL